MLTAGSLKIVSKQSQNEHMVIITYNVRAIPPIDAHNLFLLEPLW